MLSLRQILRSTSRPLAVLAAATLVVSSSSLLYTNSSSSSHPTSPTSPLLSPTNTNTNTNTSTPTSTTSQTTQLPLPQTTRSFTPIRTRTTVAIVMATSEIDQHHAQITEWRQQRHAQCQSPNGWLALAGLHWLSNSQPNTIGSDPSNSIVFEPLSTPSRLGTLFLSESETTHQAKFQAEIEGITVDGAELPKGESVDLVTDAHNPDKQSLVVYGSLSFFIIKRGTRFAIRLKDSRAPSLLNFTGIDSFPISWNYRVTARFESWPDGPKQLKIPNALGEFDIEQSLGQLVFQLDGQEYRLTVPGDITTKSAMIVFGDRTSGKETYGGGRFVWVDPIDPVTHETVIDFNKAYNPPCVFTPYATCPLPLPENRLKTRIEAGEKVYGDHH